MTADQILERLVALNYKRAEEERGGLIRWLRPAFQNRSAGATQLDLIDPKAAKPATAKKLKAARAAKLAWPKTLAEQAKAVRGVLQAATTALAAADVAAAFKRANADTIAELLDTLVSLG